MIRRLIKNNSNSFSMTKLAIRKSNIINPNIHMYRVKIDNTPGILYKVLKRLNKLHLNYSNIESSFIMNEPDKVHIDLFFETNKRQLDRDLLDHTLGDLNANVMNLAEPLLPNFPIQLSDLNNMGIELQNPGDGLNQEHPGFSDKEYKRRRDLIASNSKGIKMLEPIPRISYSEQESNLWKTIYTTLRPKLFEHGCEAYARNLELLEHEKIFTPDHVPQLEDINNYLIKKTNWRIKPVNGILSQREYLNCLAFRTFCSTQYLRHHSKPFFTPEPDIVHEFIGHIPNFSDPVFCDISQKLGVLSLGASDRLVKLIGAVYWFTIEFGLCKENNKMKFYGAGVASSLDEMENYLKCDKIYKLDLAREYPPVDFVVQDVQPFYYYIDRFEEYLNQLTLLANQTNKLFNYNFDAKSEHMYIDRKIKVYESNENH